MFSFSPDFSRAQRAKAINNTAELYSTLSEDLVKAMMHSYSMLGNNIQRITPDNLKKIIAEDLKLFFNKNGLKCYFIDEAINALVYGQQKYDFGLELMREHKLNFKEVENAEAALVKAAKELEIKITDACNAMNEKIQGDFAAKKKEIRDGANYNAKMIALSTIHLVVGITMLLSVLALVAAVAFPPIALAAAASGLTSGLITLSTGTTVASFAVPVATAVASRLIGSIVIMEGENLLHSVREKDRKALDAVSTNAVTELTKALSNTMHQSELITLGVTEFAKKHGKEAQPERS